MPTKKRIDKVKKVLSFRQPDLRVVLEGVKNTHNASAVTRTCDAAGILYLDIISPDMEPFPVNEAISTRAEKWIQINYYKSPSECLSKLKKKGFQIAATSLEKEALPYYSLNYIKPTAVVFGNEAEGLSKKTEDLSDHKIKIPMFGMAQSLNLSVSVGIILYEAIKQRKNNNLFGKRGLSPEEFDFYYKKWLGS